MKQFFLALPVNIIGCFAGRMLIWHIAAIILTFILVASGFDWFYFCSTRSTSLQLCAWPAVIIGQLIPLTLPLYLVLLGIVAKNATAARTGWAIGQAVLIGLLVASTYKAFTGRPHPPKSMTVDTSHVFHVGFLRGGVFWGWPSSHTATAFAMSVTLFTLFPKQRWLRVIAIAYAFYIGIGVSMTIHWFSDFVAGAIIGTVIGVTVGKNFYTPTASLRGPSQKN
jgi:membrane-associated phospholipid phosphatase